MRDRWSQLGIKGYHVERKRNSFSKARRILPFMLSGYRFEMIIGCMSAGKSSELIRRVERARLAYLPTVIFRPAMDTRSKPDAIESRNGLQSHAVVVPSPKDMLKYSSQAVVIGIDEVQFFDNSVVEVIVTLLKQRKKIIASGLDLDYRGKPFGPVPELLALADRVDKLMAVCRKCGSDFACRTQRTVQSSEQILVGDSEYEARCLDCFDPPSEFQLKIDLQNQNRELPGQAQQDFDPKNPANNNGIESIVKMSVLPSQSAPV